MPVPGGDRLRRQLGRRSPATAARVNSSRNADRRPPGENPPIGREVVDDAQEHDRERRWRAADVNPNSRRRQRSRSTLPTSDVAPFVSVKAAAAAETGGSRRRAIAPGPAFVPEEIGQDGGLDRDRGGARRRPVRARREHGEHRDLHQESDDADADECNDRGLMPPSIQCFGSGSGSARYSALVLRIDDGDKRDQQADRRNDAADIEELRSDRAEPNDAHGEHGGLDRADRNHDSQFGRSEAEKRHPENARRRGSPGTIPPRRAGTATSSDQRDERVHQPGTRHAREQQRRAGHIDDVIDVEPVSRPLLVPDARDRAVEAVAEPVRHQRDDHAERRPVRYTDRRRTRGRRRPSRPGRAPTGDRS